MIDMSLLPPNLINFEDSFDVDIGFERIPFSNSSFNTFKSDSSSILRKVLQEDKENQTDCKKMASSSKQNHRKPLGETGPNKAIERPTTPTNENDSVQPLTPTANLKMLFSAVSPELRNREEKKKELFAGSEIEDGDTQKLQPLNLDGELAASQIEDSLWKPGSRKEKSLGLLCQKFLQKYKEYPKPHECTEISLDEVAKELAVERRRIYDIVNVLESVELVSRIAKNRYAWHGKTNLVTTLAKLRALGEAEGFAQQIEKVKDYELNRELEEQNGIPISQSKLHLDNPGLELLRKDKSLGIMSQKFLMLFLVSRQKMVNLDLAAKILIGDPNIDRTENAKFKTKIRRLYDIANILATLNLIRKIRITEIRDRKPTYQYIGPDIDHMSDLNVCYNDGYHRPSSRHSMLDCVKNSQVVDILTPPGLPAVKMLKSCEKGSLSEVTEQTAVKKDFSRHSSFEQICQFAEEELSKMYASQSQPASPTAEKEFDDFPKSLSQEAPITVSTITKSGKKADKKIYPKSNSSESEDQKVNKPCTPQTTSNVKKTTVEQIIVKSNNKSQPAVQLTKDQIDAVLKSLKVPVPIKKLENQEEISNDLDTTEKKPAKNSANEGKRSLSDFDEIETTSKRIKIEFPSPPTDEENIAQKKPNVISILRINGKGKPSPQRALIPHFLNTQVTSQSRTPIQNANTVTENLTFPFLERESTDDSAQVHCGNVMQKASMQSIAVQLPNQQPTILQFPVTQVPPQSREMQNSTPNLAQPMQVLQGVPVSATGFTGQPINFIVPVTFSPPLTPHTPSSNQTVFTFPNHLQQQNSIGYSTVQYLHQSASVPSIENVSPIMTRGSQNIPQLVTPTDRPVAPPSKFFGNTPGSLIPLSTISAVGAGMNGKEIFSTARKLDLPDISA